MVKDSRSFMNSMVTALGHHDAYAVAHARRVVVYSQAMAVRLDLPDRLRHELAFGAYLHDIGKLGIDRALLVKPTHLSAAEREIVQRHPGLGILILQSRGFSLQHVLDIIFFHHERYDGQGYPLGLNGEDIPLLARVFAVADVFDAVTSDRPYRRALTVGEARDIIRQGVGREFCPVAATVFLSFSPEELAAFRRLAENQYYNPLLDWEDLLAANLFMGRK